MVALYRFIFGYVRVMICGESQESLINLLIENDISIWSIKRRNNCTFFNLSFSNYRKIRELRKSLKVKPRIRIVKKRGITMSINNVFVRKSIIFGILLSIAINIVLSNFIWIIEINGANKISEEDVITSLNSKGIHFGINRKSVDTYDLTQKIALDFDDIAWISLNIEGSKLSVNISEAEDSNTDNTPANLVSDIDGVIRSIKTTQGSSAVKIGQTIKKGELLISGIESIGDKTRYVHASGEVVAETHRTFTAKVPKKLIIKTFENEIEVRNVVEFFNIRVPLYLSDVKEHSGSYLDIKPCKFFNKDMPICIARRYFLKNSIKEINPDLNYAQNIAISEFEKQIRLTKIINIENKEITYSQNEVYYIFTLEALCSEYIGEIKNIDFHND